MLIYELKIQLFLGSYLHTIHSRQSSLSADNTRFISVRVKLSVVATFTVPYKPTYIIAGFLGFNLFFAIGIQNENKALKIENHLETKHSHCS